MQDIKELSPKELESVFEAWQEPAFRAKQVLSWLYKKGATDFNQMTDIPSGLRVKLKDNFYIYGLKLIKRSVSQDGTEKFLFCLKDKNLIEAVVIPTKNRITACISTQVGCKFACLCCASGRLGFKRNLTCGEMIEEVLYLKNNSKDKKLTHIVFMGTGEPLDNYENVLETVRILNSKDAFAIAARRITISTCGIIPGINRLKQEDLQVELSISLHSADDLIRSQIMPINKKYPLSELIGACRKYIKQTGRQVTFEYILIKGMNSDLQSALKLVKILKGLNCKVNLIPFNPLKELKLNSPSKAEIIYFRDYLLEHGINVTLRRPRGIDIEAACGQLRLRYEK